MKPPTIEDFAASVVNWTKNNKIIRNVGVLNICRLLPEDKINVFIKSYCAAAVPVLFSEAAQQHVKLSINIDQAIDFINNCEVYGDNTEQPYKFSYQQVFKFEQIKIGNLQKGSVFCQFNESSEQFTCVLENRKQYFDVCNNVAQQTIGKAKVKDDIFGQTFYAQFEDECKVLSNNSQSFGKYFENRIQSGITIDQRGYTYCGLFDQFFVDRYLKLNNQTVNCHTCTYFMKQNGYQIQIFKQGYNIKSLFQINQKKILLGNIDAGGNGFCKILTTIGKTLYQCGQFKRGELTIGYEIQNLVLKRIKSIKQQKQNVFSVQHTINPSKIVQKVYTNGYISKREFITQQSADYQVLLVNMYQVSCYLSDDLSLFIGKFCNGFRAEVALSNCFQFVGVQIFIDGHKLKGEMSFGLSSLGKMKTQQGAVLKGDFVNNGLIRIATQSDVQNQNQPKLGNSSVYHVTSDRSTFYTLDRSVTGYGFEFTDTGEKREGLFGNQQPASFCRIENSMGQTLDGEFKIFGQMGLDTVKLQLSGKVKVTERDLKVHNQMFYQGNECRGSFDEFGNGDGTVINKDDTIKRGHFKNAKLFGKGSITLMDGRSVEGQFYDDWLLEGEFDVNGTGKGRMSSMDEWKEGDFICGYLVSGSMHYSCRQVHEGSFIAEMLVRGTITYENGRVEAIE